MEKSLQEIVNILNKFDWVSFWLTIATILISIIAIIISVITGYKNSKRDAKSNLMELRLNFYTDCINTYVCFKGNLTDILSINEYSIIKMMNELENQEIKLMRCANTCNFLFEDDELICTTIKNLYSKFSQFKNMLFTSILDGSYKNQFEEFLNNKKIKKEEIYKNSKLELYKLASQFALKNTELISLSNDVKNILINPNFDNMFKKYINIK